MSARRVTPTDAALQVRSLESFCCSTMCSSNEHATSCPRQLRLGMASFFTFFISQSMDC